jgi:hypothetical protein
MKKKYPVLSSLAVAQETGNPSADFYDDMDIAAEQRRCFVHDWLAHDIPSIEDLEEAYKAGEEIKKFYATARRKAAAA